MLSKLEYAQLIKLVKEKAKKNPYDREVKDLLKSLKNKKNYIYDCSDLEKAQEFINAFYDIGIYSTKNPTQISKGEISKSVEYMILVKEYKEANKKLRDSMRQEDISDKALEFLIEKHTNKILGIGARINELVN